MDRMRDDALARGIRTLRVTYEDLVKDKGAGLERVAKFVAAGTGCDAAGFTYTGEERVRRRPPAPRRPTSRTGRTRINATRDALISGHPRGTRRASEGPVESRPPGVRTTSKLKVVEQLRERELLRAVDRDGAERQRRKVEGQHEVVHARDRGLEYCDYHRIQHELPAGQVDGLVEEEEGKNASHEGGLPT